MKKILLTLIAIPFFIILPVFTSKAYTQEDVELYKTEYLEYYGGSVSNAFIENILTAWENGGIVNNTGKPYLYTYNEMGSYRNSMLCNSASRINNSGYLQVYSGDLTSSPDSQAANGNDTVSFYFSPTGATFQISSSYKPKYWGTFDEWKSTHVDYSNIFYLPQIPSPDIVMRYNSLNMNNDYCVPAVAEIAPASISGYDLYLNVKAKLYVPTTVNISINNGHVSYDAVTLESSDIIDVLDYGSNYSMENEDIFDLDLNTISDGILQSEWQNLKSNTSTVFTGQLSGSSAFQSAVSDYNQYSKNALTMGNRVELFFTIYLVKDGVAYQGLTLRWYSTTPDTFDLSQNAYNVLGIITSKYNVVSDSVAKVYQSENASTPPNDPNDSSYLDLDAFIPYIMRQGSLKTAGSVPNNQNYPTIVAYNHDNIFTMFKDYYSSASEFFGGFAPFMNATLQWVPDEIWIIVAMGFMVAVIVMIVKVL